MGGLLKCFLRAVNKKKSHCRANMAHVRQSRPDPGLGSQVKALTAFKVVLCSFDSGLGCGLEGGRSCRDVDC